MKKTGEIHIIAGKKVVRYVEGLSPCPPCVFYEEGCTCLEYCRKFDRGGETAYFVEAEQPQEKDDREFCKNNCKGFRDTGGRCFADGDCKAKQEADLKASIGIGTDTWFQQLKVGDKVETYDGRIETIRKKYEDSFMLGFDAEGRENCAPDGYFPIAISECRPFVDQSSSIAPDADLEAEIERWWNERYAKLKKEYRFDSTSGHYLDNETIIDLARHFYELGLNRKK